MRSRMPYRAQVFLGHSSGKDPDVGLPVQFLILWVWSLLTCRALEQRREIESRLYKKPNEFCGAVKERALGPRSGLHMGLGAAASMLSTRYKP